MPHQPYVTAGTVETTIPVDISFRIIELFSGMLYSSPHKAVEELVSNSYDAMAGRVDVVLSADLTASDAAVWVIDDGDGMDLDGLIALWQIGDSPKTDERDDPDADRALIGKFGIGKLATYVLARKLTYLTSANGSVRAVTMDFGAIPAGGTKKKPVTLTVRKLTKADLKSALVPLNALPGGSARAKALVDTFTKDSWTTVAMSDLKPKAEEVKHGRLRWLLSTALPNNPGFALYLNGKKVDAAKESRTPLLGWTIGTRPDLEDHDTVAFSDDDGDPYVEIDDFPGKLRGEVAIYANQLDSGDSKSEKISRSHGFFVMVRDRLINLDDELFGLTALSHAAFPRFRMVVHADGLDQFITSAREGVQEAPAVGALRAFLRREFNAARTYYDNWLNKADKTGALLARVARTAASTSRGPLISAAVKVLTGQIEPLTLIHVPVDLDDSARDALISELESTLDADPDSPDGPIADMVLVSAGPDDFLATYDAETRIVSVNTLHPFYVALIEGRKDGDTEALRLLLLAEVLTEAYLVDAGLDAAGTSQVVQRRDLFFRELVAATRGTVLELIERLLDAKTDQQGLERTVVEAFGALGFEAVEIAGNDAPDGLAKAKLGLGEKGQPADYSFTTESKSTKARNQKVKAKTVGVSTVDRHRRDHNADFTVVVAPDFSGADKELGALNDELKNNSFITALRVDDLALLLAISRRVNLGYTRLRELFEIEATRKVGKKIEVITRGRTAEESAEWVRSLLNEPSPVVPDRDLLETVAELMPSYQVSFQGISIALKTTKQIVMSQAEVGDQIRAIAARARGLLTVNSTDPATVRLESSVEKILAALARTSEDVGADAAVKKLLATQSPAGVAVTKSVAKKRVAKKLPANPPAARKPGKKATAKPPLKKLPRRS